jgi:N-acetyl-gamma-glutamyl-phosphate reductase
VNEYRVVVAGASGYAGALAASLLWRHPSIELVRISARSDLGKPLAELYPRYRVPLVLDELDLERLEDVDAAIVAYPHGAAAPVVAEMRGLGIQVVDLSADFRLREIPTYERWYGPHGEPDLLAGAVYGLTELYRDQVRNAGLVANPGCYPTAAVLALAPLAERGLITDVVIDAKSGASGAGRDAHSFVDVGENFSPYGVDGHRHLPEIEQEIYELLPAVSSAARRGAAGSEPARTDATLAARPAILFVPHLLPLDQGLLASCYATLSEQIDAEGLRALYGQRYADEPFVEVTARPPGVRDVRDTNLCLIHPTVGSERNRAIVFAAIDNLWKGASGQAVQNLNLMLGLSETEGLE